MSLARQIVPADAAPEVRDLDLNAIKLDPRAQPRDHLSTEKTGEYAEAMAEGAKFPPLVVFFDGTEYWLADGFHRHYAAQHAQRKAIACEIRRGGLREAVLFSVGANALHGLPRSEADRRRAIMIVLADEEWGQWSDREVARRCRVHHTTVARVRADLDKFYSGDRGPADGRYRPGREAVFKYASTYVPGDVASEAEPRARKFRSKHGTPATMKTAGINAGRKPFQAKASEDNGSTTGEAGAVAGEASRLASGRTDAGEAVSADLPTHSEPATPEPVESKGVGPLVDEKPATPADPLQAAWDAADRQTQDAFLSSNGLTRKAVRGTRTSLSPETVAHVMRPRPERKPFVLRPHCLNREVCAGVGAEHCHTCKRAMAVGEVEQ